MRTDQMVGLNDRALSFLNKGEKKYTDYVHREYEDGTLKEFTQLGTEDNTKCEVFQEFEGAWNKMELNKYIFPDGTEYFEYIQAEPWSSGPCYFLALKDRNGNIVQESLWTEEEISQNT